MNNKEITRDDDADPSLDLHSNYDSSEIIGTWFNCDPDTRQIHHLSIIDSNGELYIQVFAALSNSHLDWGTSKIAPFISIPDSNLIGGFTCSFDFGFMETQICSNIKRGILVIQAYNIFKDNSGRPNYYSREFFNQ
ncbi:MAG: hypothetical protein P1U56_20760 [Saprospiraceae bacterium]|nr:hypothetical protein [Saprospiraceae bacterium]